MQRLTALFAATMRAAAFLTRLSISGRFFERLPSRTPGLSPESSASDASEGTGTQRGAAYRLGDDADAFPLVGLIAAAPAAVLMIALPALGLSPLVSAIIAVASLVAMTGALHEDGLADVADGLFGHQPKERALEIMHDSRVGSYGAIALVLSLSLRAALLAELAATRPLLAAAAVFAAAAASRGAMAVFWALTPSALDTGLAARAGQPTRDRGRLSLGIGAAIGLLVAMPLAGILSALAATALAALAVILFRRIVVRRIGGQTGDCLGTAQQLCEIAILLGLSIGS